MVDPSVHRFRMNPPGRDESSGGSDFGSARKESSRSVYEGAARRPVRRSRSRTRRPSGNRAERMNTPQKNRDPKKSLPIEEHSNGDTSSASSSSSRASSSSESKGSTSSSSSKQSSSDRESSQSAPISSGESFLTKNTATLRSEDISMQASIKPTSRGKTFQDYSETSGSEDESMHSSPGPTSKEKASSDNDSASSGSEDESMHSSPGPTSKGKESPFNYSASSGSEDESRQTPPGPTSKGKASPENDSETSGSEDASMQSPPTSKGKAILNNQSASSGSEDESMQSPPTSKGKAIPDNQSASSGSEYASMHSSPRLKSKRKLFSDKDSETSGSEDESIQLSTRPKSKGKSSPHNHSTAFSSEDESIQPSNRPTSKGNAVPDTFPASSGSEDESMQPPPGPTSKGKAVPKTPSATSASEDESQPKPRGLEEISSATVSQGSPDENAGAKPIEDQFWNEWGDKLTVKFKVSLPEVGNDLIGGPLQFLRVPQFIPVEAGAFDAESFKDSMTPDDLKDEQARGDFLNRLKTTVRWRENQDKVKESNARIVRWSDGTETFHVGAEVFDVMHHKVNDDKNQLYVRLESCYQVQGSITDKMTLRPKLDSTFGQSHVQGLRNRAMNKPQTGLVKVLSDLVANPMVDREQRVKADLANLRKEDRLKRREIQLSLRKPRVQPMRHCTADDSDVEQATGEQGDKIGRNSTQGIRTNRNVAVNPGKVVSTDEEDDEDEYDSDVNDIINDEELDYYEDDDVDEELSDEPRSSTSKPKRALRRSPKSDNDEGPKVRTGKRKSKRLIFSDSSSG